MYDLLADEELPSLTRAAPGARPRRTRARPGIPPRPQLGPAASHLLLGFAAGLVDRVLVLLGGFARILLLLVVFGRLREGEKDGR